MAGAPQISVMKTISNTRKAAPQPATETARYWADSRIAGLEMLKAQYVRHTFARHAHEGFALGVILHGALAFRYLGRNHVAQPGTVNLTVPGEVHDGHGADSAGWAYRMFYLSPQFVLAAATEAGMPAGRLPEFSSGVLQDPALARGLTLLHTQMEQQDATMPVLEQQVRLNALLAHWIHAHANRNTCTGATGPQSPAAGSARQTGSMPRAGCEPRAVRLAREYLDAHSAEDVRLEVLALHAGLSPYHLSRVFCRTLGMPPHAYLTQRRVFHARALLATDTPLADIALTCGFADQSHLTRQFKRVLGVPPGALRKNVQEQ
ncbi:transcriptional regulator [Desulfovibrio psychrotolerans]|uniref:Transcriptional regulator n=2 Tax=Desulfovibrio psychrotolerans TaxID=415242 RepID=A0A7J0BXT3_9BACT|nr:transcriptional regulator [Desulfovibrio psychrotolerans]